MGDLQSYELVFELLDDLVFVSNEENDIIYANKSAKMIYGSFLAHLSPKQYTAELPDDVGATLKKFKEDFVKMFFDYRSIWITFKYITKIS